MENVSCMERGLMSTIGTSNCLPKNQVHHLFCQRWEGKILKVDPWFSNIFNFLNLKVFFKWLNAGYHKACIPRSSHGQSPWLGDPGNLLTCSTSTLEAVQGPKPMLWDILRISTLQPWGGATGRPRKMFGVNSQGLNIGLGNQSWYKKRFFFKPSK